MIRYSLKCDQGHTFESWFASAAAYDALAKAGHVGCVQCGSTRVEKALMAPSVAQADAEVRPLATPTSDLEQKLAALRKQVEESSDYVGRDFAREARAMQAGESPERPIWGEARIDEAKALIEDGVPVAPLPFIGKARAN
ncbi:DUF1178 family protein [Pararhodobacter aggregans]